MDDWTELRDLYDVSKAMQMGWEIEVQPDPGNDKYCPWKAWDGKHWCTHYLFRGRPAAPKTRKIKLLAWFNGSLNWYEEGDVLADDNWKRVPAEDKVIEVTE